MRFRLAFVLLICLFLPVVHAAGEPLNERIILGKDHVSLARLDTLDGLHPAETVSAARWRQAAFELGKSISDKSNWLDPRVLNASARNKQDWRTVSLALLHSAYEQEDSAGVQRKTQVFALSPLRQSTHYGRNLQLELPVRHILGSGSAAIQSLHFDAGDGGGFRSIEPDLPFTVSYASTGTKRLALEATLTDGRTLQSTSQLDVRALDTPDPHETWAIQADQLYDGVAGTGQAYVYLAEGHASVINPVVVVEGFDIDNTIDWPVLYDLLNRENLLEDLRSEGYDAIVLDFTEAVDPIQRNAFVLTKLLDQLAAEIHAQQTITLIGASMGGLVSRYALLWMEQSAIVPRVRNFISFDTPHKGANIPMGLQEWVDFFSDLSEDADFLKTRLNAAASRQMLLYHRQSRVGNAANPDPMFDALQTELLGMGDWPLTSRLVSIINGSGTMSGQGFAAGEQILQYDYSSVLIAITGNVWAVPAPADPLTTVFDGLTRIGFIPTTRETSLQSTLAWDNSPGGSRATMQQAADTTAPYGDIIALYPGHSFIPSVSGFGLDTSDPWLDIDGDPGVLAASPFDQGYYPAENQEHIEINVQNKAWFMHEIVLEETNFDIMFMDGFENPAPAAARR